MKWQVLARPEAKDDILQTADWYDQQRAGLGDEFIEEIVAVFDALATDPLFQSQPHTTKKIRWRYPKRFPYRVVYEVLENEHIVIIGAVLHAARRDAVWKSRF